MNLVREFIYRISTTNPIPATTGSRFGQRMYAAIVEGEIEGPRLRASLAAPGSDWRATAVTAIFDPTCMWRFVQTMGKPYWYVVWD